MPMKHLHFHDPLRVTLPQQDRQQQTTTSTRHDRPAEPRQVGLSKPVTLYSMTGLLSPVCARGGGAGPTPTPTPTFDGISGFRSGFITHALIANIYIRGADKRRPYSTDFHFFARFFYEVLATIFFLQNMSCCRKTKATFNGFPFFRTLFPLGIGQHLLLAKHVVLQKNERHIQRISMFLHGFSSRYCPAHASSSTCRAAEKRRPYSTDFHFDARFFY